jgi:hypothetical protein
MTETTADKPKKVQDIDPVLFMFLGSVLGDFRKDKETAASVTFVVAGETISGYVIPEGRWLQLLKDLLLPANPRLEVPLDMTIDMVETYSQKNRDENEGLDLKTPQHIGLRDAVLIGPDGAQHIGLLRVRVTDISAWWPGVMA